jgi:hypothetical protein
MARQAAHYLSHKCLPSTASAGCLTGKRTLSPTRGTRSRSQGSHATAMARLAAAGPGVSPPDSLLVSVERGGDDEGALGAGMPIMTAGYVRLSAADVGASRWVAKRGTRRGRDQNRDG